MAKTSKTPTFQKDTRKKPAKSGTKGGKYYRIEIRPKSEFKLFRYHDVGDAGHLVRLAGKRYNGTWATHAWLVSKEDASVEKGTLVAQTSDAKELIESLGSIPTLKKNNIFKASPRKKARKKKSI